MSSKKTGLVAVAKYIQFACSVCDAWRPKINAALDAAVSAGKIRSADAATAKACLDSIVAACSIFKAASGY